MHAADGEPAPPDPMIGTQLGKDYRVIERIGVGGMGVVYMVEHASLRKRFAAKVLSKELAADAEARARFQTEAHAASQLDHENIVTLTDYGVTDDGRPYIVMEFLRGRTLDQRLAEGPLSLEEIVAIVIPVARALAEAHAEGIVHRDVKPENVFLTQRSGGLWGIKVLDFGIAKTPIKGSKLTKTGQALGSPMYMAPEACRGDEVDHRADIYSLGVLMYLLWCGQVPFDDDNLLKVLQMQVSDPVPPPHHARPDLSPELEAVILRALEKDPDRRFLSIAMLLAALEAALPPDADRLLIQAARGTTSMRALGDPTTATPFPTRTTATSHPRTAPPPAAAPPRASVQMPVAPPGPSFTVAGPAPTARRRGLLIAGGVAAIALVVAIYALTRPHDRATAQASAEPPHTTGSGSAVGPRPDPSTTRPTVPDAVAVAVDAGATAVAVPTLAVDAAPATIAVRVRTTTAGAEVSLDGAPLGVTPLDVTVPAAARSVQLRVELAGHRPWTQTVSLDAPIELEPTLVAVAKSTPRPTHASSGARPDAGTGSGAGSAGSGRGSATPDLGIRTSR